MTAPAYARLGNDSLYSVAEAARILKCSVRTNWRMAVSFKQMKLQTKRIV